MEDPDLIGKSVSIESVSNENDPPTSGLYLIGLTKEQLEIFGLFFNDLYEKVRNKYRPRQVTRNAITMLNGAIFALGTKKSNNPEWKEHCASSLREVIHEWNDAGKFESDFALFYRSSKSSLLSTESATFKSLRLHYQYFSSIDHHNASGVQSSLITLLKDNSLKLEDCFKDDIFLERVKIFFSDISKIVEYSKQKK